MTCGQGATDGIGKAVAMELAKKGLNIVLISRTQVSSPKDPREFMPRPP